MRVPFLSITSLVFVAVSALPASAQDPETGEISPEGGETSPAPELPLPRDAPLEAASSSPSAPAPTSASPEPTFTDSASYEGRVLAGLRYIVLHDFEAAIASFRKAAQIEPGVASAFCHLGDAQLEKGDLAEAKAAYESCARFAALSSDPRHTSLSQIGLARVVERGKANMSEKRDAWKRASEGIVEQLAKSFADARVAMYDAAITRENDYSGVRKRIVARDVAREATQEQGPEQGF